ncbi:dienelactone hydrolase family protein [Roseomonas sp. CCTCC AB2023176]|uniref:dienelactone hydrolase family protein n=1 Tax=Roseomonas sp. CCTCC AB2023176 TaxID=3342640 RepID=UPI0035E368D0
MSLTIPPADEMISPPVLDRLPRRGLLTSVSLGAGYTLAAGPVIAQTIVTTPADGLVAGEVTIPVGAVAMPAYRARPASGSAWPVVIVCQEIFGLHEYIKDVTRRLAKEGFLAVAPDYYVRQGDAARAADVGAAAAIANRKPDAELFGDLDATYAWAVADGGNADRLGITGYCRGGRNVWAYAAHNPHLKAGVAWYGPVAGTPSDLTPRVPLDMAADIRCPILGLYGEADTGIPVEGLRRMQAAMRAVNKPFELVIYPDAPHGFHADYRPTYRPGPAADGWRRMLDFFRANGVG